MAGVGWGPFNWAPTGLRPSTSKKWRPLPQFGWAGARTCTWGRICRWPPRAPRELLLSGPRVASRPPARSERKSPNEWAPFIVYLRQLETGRRGEERRGEANIKSLLLPTPQSRGIISFRPLVAPSGGKLVAHLLGPGLVWFGLNKIELKMMAQFPSTNDFQPLRSEPSAEIAHFACSSRAKPAGKQLGRRPES